MKLNVFQQTIIQERLSVPCILMTNQTIHQ